MSDLTTQVLEQLRAARREVDGRIAELTAEGERIDAAIALFDDVDVPAVVAPPSVELAADAERTAGITGTGLVDRQVDLPKTPRGSLSADRNNGQPSEVTPEQVLEHIGEEWVSAGPIARAVGLSKSSLRPRLEQLIEEELIERTGVRAGTRYRLARADGSEAVDLEAEPDDDGEIVDDAAEPEQAPTPVPQVGRDLERKIEGVLERAGEPTSAAALARSLVVPLEEVATTLRAMVASSDAGHRFPAVHRDTEGGYSLAVGLAA